jgi:hypothetical protein
VGTVYFSSSLGKSIEFTDERRRHILHYHPDLAPFLDRLGEVLISPNEIRKTFEDPQVLLFYKFYPDILRGKYIVVAVKVNDRSFILTAYLTRRMKTGESL